MGNVTSTALPWLAPGVAEAADAWFLGKPEQAMAMVHVCGSSHWRGGVLWPRILEKLASGYSADNRPSMLRVRDTMEFDATDASTFALFTEVFYISPKLPGAGGYMTFPVEKCSEPAKLATHFRTQTKFKPIRFNSVRPVPDTPDITKSQIEGLTKSNRHPFNAVIQLMVDATDLAGVPPEGGPVPLWKRIPDARAFLYWVFHYTLNDTLPQNAFLDGTMFRDDPQLWACLALVSFETPLPNAVTSDLMHQMQHESNTVATVMRWLTAASLPDMCRMVGLKDRNDLAAIERPITPTANVWRLNSKMQRALPMTMYAFMHRAFSAEAVATVVHACNGLEVMKFQPPPDGNYILPIYVDPAGAAPPEGDGVRRKIPATTAQ